MRRFENRIEAGRALGELLRAYRNSAPIVLALPRGGVPVGYEVARALGASLDVFLVRKLGVPGNEEYAMGAIASGGAIILNDDVIARLDITNDEVRGVVEREARELKRREAAYRGLQGRVPVEGRTVIVVDDGMATGSSMRVALDALRLLRPAKIIVAVPVASREAMAMVRNHADDWACLMTPEPFGAVGAWYLDFQQTTDDEVRQLLLDQVGRRTRGMPDREVVPA